MTDRIATIGQLVAAVQDGSYAEHLSVDMRELVGQMQDHIRDVGGKAKGRIVLQFDLTLDREGIMLVAPSSKIVGPAEVKRDSVFWLTTDGNLSRENPRQMKMDLVRAAPEQPASVRTVNES